MADSAKVRLVRCPKCENLLPELADYSVYQCGGCGAVLRAKAKRVESEKPNEEAVGLANSSEKRAVDSGATSNSDAKLVSGSFRRDHAGFEFDKEVVRNGNVNGSEDEGVLQNGLDSSANRRDKSASSLGREFGDPNSDHGSRIDFRRSSRMSEEFGRSARAEFEGVRFSTSNYDDEGPSRARSLEQDRVSLLQKLDELRDQLSRSCEVSNSHMPKEKLSRDNRPFMEYARPEKHVGSPNFSRFAEPVPYNNGYEIPTHGFFPSVAYPSHAQGFGDPFGPQLHKGPPHHFPRPYQPSQPYFSGQYIDNNPDPFEPYSHNPAFHQSSCACFQCYKKHRRASATVPPPFFANKRFNDVQSNPAFYHSENPGLVGPSNPNKSWQSHTRCPSDLGHDMGHGHGRGHGRGRKLMYAGGRCCRPVCSGAPFLGCSNCFEILKLPKKMLLTENARRKLKCGACSTIMDLVLVDKKIVVSVSSENVQSPAEVTNGSNNVAGNSSLYPQGHMNRSYAFSSDDYDNAGYDFQAMDREPVSLQVDPGFVKPHEALSFLSSSLCTSDDGNSPDIPVAKKEATNSAQHPVKTNLSPPPPGSPLQEHFDFSTNNRLANRLGKGNQSSRSDQENVKPNKIASRQNSLNKVSLATEMEVSFNEYSNTGISQDSGDASRTEEPVRINNKGGDSFFANIIKKSFKDFSRSNQADERGKISVYVNGHPITDRALKKAQKLAGPIHPGQYWYDYRAGFWGIIGGSCLGIVLPYIEELNYPMPENCSGGTTGVYVNGRELHQKDLDLLASRGLPTSRDRSYIIEISGRVLDEDTGEELDCLGKLAPTVEKAKHGFGMKAPKVVQPDQSS